VEGALMVALGPRADRALALLAFLTLWAIGSVLAGHSALPGPVETFAHAAALVGRPSFLGHVRETLSATMTALAISVLGGVTLGVVLGANRFVGQVAEPILVALYSLPKVTFYPIVLLVFGLGFSAKVAFGAIHGLVPVTMFTLGAVRGIPAIYLKSARVMGASPWFTARRVIVPAVLPEVMTGIRVGFSLTLLGTLVGELFASQAGLGFLLKRAMSTADSLEILAVTVLLFAFAVGVNLLLTRVSAWIAGSKERASGAGAFRGRLARGAAAP